jgi:hypothetical protein
MNKGEPPSRCLSRTLPMLIGKNSRGQWVVQSQDGLCGGLFVNRTEAIRFAMFENGRRPEAVIMVSGNLELALNIPAKPATAPERDNRSSRAEHATATARHPLQPTLVERHLSPLPARAINATQKLRQYATG